MEIGGNMHMYAYFGRGKLANVDVTEHSTSTSSTGITLSTAHLAAMYSMYGGVCNYQDVRELEKTRTAWSDRATQLFTNPRLCTYMKL